MTFANGLQLLTGLALVTLGAAACGESRPEWEPSDPEEQVALVQQGISGATGTVDASSVKEIQGAYVSVGLRQAAVLEALAKVKFAGEQCVVKSADEGTVDLSCASDGKVSGSATFSVDGEITAESTEIFIELTTEDACVDKVCFDGSFALEAKAGLSGVTTTLAASTTTTVDGEDTQLFLGVQTVASIEEVTTKIALFDSGGRSFTYTAAIDGTFIIEGTNGTFSCTSEGAGGKCTGSTEFTY